MRQKKSPPPEFRGDGLGLWVQQEN